MGAKVRIVLNSHCSEMKPVGLEGEHDQAVCVCDLLIYYDCSAALRDRSLMFHSIAVRPGCQRCFMRHLGCSTQQCLMGPCPNPGYHELLEGRSSSSSDLTEESSSGKAK